MSRDRHGKRAAEAPRPSVVIVDDDEDMRFLLTVLFQRAGCEVAGEAANGAEAVGVVKTTRPEFVVMDLTMPVMDGATATRAILELEPDTRVVGFSAMYGSQLLEAGAEALFVKNETGLLVDYICLATRWEAR